MSRSVHKTDNTPEEGNLQFYIATLLADHVKINDLLNFPKQEFGQAWKIKETSKFQ